MWRAWRLPLRPLRRGRLRRRRWNVLSRSERDGRPTGRPRNKPMPATLTFLVVLPDTVMLSACVVLTLAVLIFVFWIEPDPADSAPHRSQLDRLMERRDAIYENLRDLKFE